MRSLLVLLMTFISPEALSVGINSTGYIIPHGTSVTISEHGQCRKVVTAVRGIALSLFIYASLDCLQIRQLI